jgi:hypothetical protein
MRRVARVLEYPRQTCGEADLTVDAPENHRAEVLREAGYGSIAVNYLLHCLPGPLRDKGRVVFEHLTPWLDPREGRLFGATILGQGVRHNALGRRLMAFYNGKGIFGNVEDNEDDLRRLLSEHFAAHELEIHGCVALFVGYVQPRN